VLGIIKKAQSKGDLILYPREGRSVDIVTRVQNKALLLKVTENLDELSKQEVSDLKKVRVAYDAYTVIIAQRDEKGDLEDEVVYYKYDNVAVTPKTLEDYIVKGQKSLVAYIRGNYVLKINPEKLRERASESGISRGELADLLGISKKAVYMYERGEMHIVLEKGVKLASILGEDIFEEFDIFRDTRLHGKVNVGSMPRDEVENALYRVASTMRKLCISFSRMPVDVVLRAEKPISIVKETGMDSNREKVENAEKIAENTNTKLFIIKTPGDVIHLRRIIQRLQDEDNH
ncbi:MAG: helix-turn-helix domain-containing protein, partial [Desulfurococcaceae archaeon]|nr:helix-turn-helix domain-containing protein [Desulfurococcaceae archaeon]